MNAYGTVLKDLNQLVMNAFQFTITLILLMILKAKTSAEFSKAMKITMNFQQQWVDSKKRPLY